MDGGEALGKDIAETQGGQGEKQSMVLGGSGGKECETVLLSPGGAILHCA